MVTNLAKNIQISLPNYNIKDVYGWSVNMVVLRWLQGNESYKQFVQKLVQFVQFFQWWDGPS